MSTTGPNLGLIEFATQGVVWYTEQNALERGLDGLVQPVAVDKDLTAPPGSPTNGQVYIVGGSPTGAWSGQATKVARYQNSDVVSTTAGWTFYTPKEGWRFYLQDEDKAYKFDGAAWVVEAPSASDISTGTLGLARGGTGVDLSATGSATKVLAQDGSHVISARNLVAADLPSTAVTPASYGDGTHVGAFTVDAQGRLTAASSVTITGAAPTGSAGGDLTGTYPNPTITTAAVTLAKMANLAQDQFIGRVTTSTGVPETATITATGRSLIDDTSTSAMRTTLGLGTVATLASDTDVTLAANSDSVIATQKATKAYVDAAAGGGAPTSAQYVTLALNGSLSAERVLTAGTGISLTDGGANSTITIAATGGAVAGSITYATRSSNTILGASDTGTQFFMTAAFTQTFTAAATLGNGWWCIIRNDTQDGTTVLTLDPNASETIDTLTTTKMYSGETRLIYCNGTNFFSQCIQGGFGRFTSSGTFVVPAGISKVTVECIGGGGGGGGGGGAAAGNNRRGGGGGGGGARVTRTFAPTAIGAAGASVTVTVTTGGSAGTGGTNAACTAGGAGGDTTFGTILTGFGGGGGSAGTDANRSGGTGGGEGEAGTVGSTTQAVRGGGNTATSLAGTGGAGAGGNSALDNGGFSAEYGGGAGGGVSGANAAAGGGSTWGGAGGGSGGSVNNGTPGTANPALAGGKTGVFILTGGSGGAANSNADGSNGTDGTLVLCGYGGGGGASVNSTTGKLGGNGGAIGGGGGGGGGGTSTGGNGGSGGRGECRVYYW